MTATLWMTDTSTLTGGERGYFRIDIVVMPIAEGKLCLYVAIDRTSKFVFVPLVRKTGRTSTSAFLMALMRRCSTRSALPDPYGLTENGIPFTLPSRYADGPTDRYITHVFDMRCRENNIAHRPTKVKRPWTNGQSLLRT